MLMLLIGGMSTAMAQSLSLDFDILRPASGESRVINVVLDNEFGVMALQADVVLPDGLEMVESSVENGYFELSSRIPRGMDIQANKVDANTYRMFVVPSGTNVSIKAGKGVIASFTVKAATKLAPETQMKLANISLADASTTNYDLPDFVGPVKNAELVPELIINNFNVTVGQPSKVDVLLNNVKPLSAMQFEIEAPEGISIDTENFEFSDRLQQSHNITVKKLANTDNTYRVTVNSASNGLFRNNEGVILSLYFNAANNAAAESKLVVTNPIYSDKEGAKYTDSYAFTVAVAVDGQNPADVNGDGNVNSDDLRVVINSILDNDGQYNSDVLRLIINSILGE